MSESHREIDLSPDVNGYFAGVVDEAVRARRVATTDAAKHYLAGLLGDYARGALSLEPLERPLTFLLHDALERTGVERFERLRRIGDGVLYALGFFGARMTRHGTDPRYVIGVGASAYVHAAAMLRLTGGGSAPDVLRELAEGYERFVEVMAEIADGALVHTADADGDVLKLYERWRSTGSERLASELAQLGLGPVRGSGSIH